MADTKHDVGVVQDTAVPGENVLHPTYCNIASQLLLTNRNSGSLVSGDVATLSTANTESTIQAASTGPYRPAFIVPNDIDIEGVEATKTILDTAAGWTFKPGAYVPDAAVDGPVTRGEYLAYSATAKKFTGTNAFDRRPLSAQAIALSSTAAAGTIPVLLLSPSPQICRRARVYNNADIDFPSGALTAVSFNTESYDTFGMHNVGDPTKLTVPSTQVGTAVYHLSAQITWADAGFHDILFRVDGTTYIAAHRAPTNSLGTRVDATYELAASQYVEVMVLAAAGADAKYYDDYSPVFSIMQIGE